MGGMDSLEEMAKMVNQEKKEIEGRLGHGVLLAILVSMELPEKRERKEIVERQDQQVLKVCLVHQDQEVFLVQRDPLDLVLPGQPM